MTSIFRSFIRCRKGSFAIATALTLSLMLMCIGLALDAGSAYQTRKRIQDAVDAAALAASAVLIENGSSPERARDAALNILKGQLNASGQLAYLVTPTVNITQTDPKIRTKTFTVDVTGKFELPPGPFRTLFTVPNAVFSVAGRSTSTVQRDDPISLFLVLDRSGSMTIATTLVDSSIPACNNVFDYKYPTPTYGAPCYLTKIAALKRAVGTLLNQIDISDPTKSYIRVGAVAFNWFTDPPQPLDWGTEATRTYINGLKAEGSTNSRYAMNVAHNVMTASSEDRAHLDKNGGTPRKYLIFMSDGANDVTSSDRATLGWCNAMKQAGIQIFTVAYMAPARGVELLAACASGPEFRFNVETTEQFLKAFENIGDAVAKVANRLSQ